MRRILFGAILLSACVVAVAQYPGEFPALQPPLQPARYPGASGGAVYALTTQVVGTGTVAKSPDLATYAHGTSVSCTATGSADWRFSAWSNAATGSTNPVSIIMTAAKTLVATFVRQRDIAVTTVGTGTVTSDPAGSPAWTYDDATAITLTAAAQTGYRFNSWSGDTTVANDSTLAIAALHADKAFTANFGALFDTLLFDGGDTGTLANAEFGNVDRTAITVLAWAYGPDGGEIGISPIVSCGTSTGNQVAWFMDIRSDMLRAVVSSDGTFAAGTCKEYYGTTSLSDGVWRCLAFRWDAGVLSLFHNGVIVASPTIVKDAVFTAYHPSTATTTIGVLWGSFYHTGGIGLVKIFPAALTNAQILTESTQTFTSSTASLALRTVTGTTWTDASGNNRHATLGTAPATPTVGTALSVVPIP